VVSLALPLYGDELSDAGKTELKTLAGNWEMTESIRDGKKQEIQANLSKFRIDNDKLLIGDQDVGLRITLLDPTTKPRIINIEHPETKKKLEGIYELDKNIWRLCINIEGTAERPGSFETEGTSKFVMVILERK
jgi:uncharacterized protein (TIGR03067 family)